jgi:hypothetical protein
MRIAIVEADASQADLERIGWSVPGTRATRSAAGASSCA